MLMIGLRGVGKTVLLDRIRMNAEAHGIHAIRIEAPENRSLPALLAPQIRQALLRLSRVERAMERARRGLRALAGFASALKIKYADIEVGLVGVEAEPGLADNGDLESDLQDLLTVIGESARDAGTVFAMFIDELQYIEETQLASLITALHRMSQQQLPVVLVGAGLPQLPGRMGNAKSYAERLFDFPVIDALSEEAAARAITKPAKDEGVDYEEAAVRRIIAMTHGYPYFIQEWGKHAWDVAEAPRITVADVERAAASAIGSLDAGFFRVRFDRLTHMEKKYLRAMAELGPGPHRSGDIAGVLNRLVTSLGPVRAQLIAKGMIWSPNHGDTGFTVPLFDEFMRRTMRELG